MGVAADDRAAGAGKVGPGRLVLVVGASGAGKDTLIARAKAALAGDGRVHFVRRVITRDCDPDLEAHDTLDPSAFAEMAASFALTWRAHGLSYGLPASIDAAIGAGATVVANVSRMVIDDARRRYARVRVVHVTAPADVLARRLAARGRESRAEIDRRLARSTRIPVTGPDVVTVDNGGSLDAACAAFLAALRE